MPKLVDFGLARAPGSLTVTAHEFIAGSAYFMSPEQAHGKTLDRRTDVCSLGSVLFQLLSGRLPFPGLVLAKVLQQVQKGERPRLRDAHPNASPELEAVCAKAMALEPRYRYASALELAEDLGRFLDGEPVRARSLTPWYRVYCKARRHRKALVGASALAVVASVGIPWLLEFNNQATLRRSADERLDLLSEQAELHLASGSLGGLVGVHQQLDRLGEERALGAEQVQRAERLSQRISGFGRSRKEALVGDLRSSLGKSGFVPTDERKLLQIDNELRVVEQLLPGGERVLPSDLSLLPGLSLSTSAHGDRVHVLPADYIVGGFVRDGSTILECPVEQVPVPASRYRIVVERQGVGFAELTRWMGEWGKDYDLGEVRVLPTAQVIEGMAYFEAGVQSITLPYYSPTKGYVPREYEHAAFYIDRTEVSNREYMAFLDANPQLKDLYAYRPCFLELGAEDPRWLERPVTGIAWRAARAYAEWVGKRLPTELEWNRAALGANQDPYPWGIAEHVVEEVLIPEGLLLGKSLDDREGYLRFLEYTLPTFELSMDLTSGGQAVQHLAGNVAEWTDSMAVGEVEGRLYPIPTHRRSKGWSWMGRHPYSLDLYEEEQATAPYRAPLRGFRCAKSASVP